ncbi:kynureninase [Roseivirga echinicomitans]|uniref:Kynureninase n=1 Tax=Roseivirga echinicomitans TaxID=296218 RepID=A0A150X104_9BACT|nr:kynureninase [Roseivirga echinicomitans]KYG72409.1 kynureninase [Roseivirga echinicomitans]
MTYENTLAYAQYLDKNDSLRDYRNRFHIPKVNGKDSYYFTGNSLGLQPKTARTYIEEEMKGWETLGVEGHFASSKRPWMEYHKFSKDALARIVGAKPIEVVSMNNLSVNLHLLMVSFFKPTKTRYKIICEAGAFPSDQYMFETQLKFHGLNPDEALIELKPRTGENTLRGEDILSKIAEVGDELALVLIGGVQYYTGQLFDMKAITEAGQKVGAKVGFDLAHAFGNVPLQLHDWNVDFATWCSYKYLNSGPGNVSGIFVHERYANDSSLDRFAGWWGHDEKERFKMKKGFQPMPGADGWQLSNVNVISTASHLAALELFDEVGIEKLRKKSLKLTGYLEFLIKDIGGDSGIFEIITPSDPEQRGCQLSIFFHKDGRRLFDALAAAGVIADWREPNVIRIAPVPLYNRFEDVYQFAHLLKKNL